MNRLYATLGIFVFIGLAWWQYSSAITDRDMYKKQSEDKTVQIDNVLAVLEKKELDLKEANQRTKVHLDEKLKIESEAEANRKCIADRTCGFELRWQKQICANSMPSTSSSRPPVNDTSQTSGQTFEEWYIEVETAAALNEALIENLQKDVLIRSDPKSCEPKNLK